MHGTLLLIFSPSSELYSKNFVNLLHTSKCPWVFICPLKERSIPPPLLRLTFLPHVFMMSSSPPGPSSIMLWQWTLSFPGGSVGKESAWNAGDYLRCRRPGFDPWVRNIPWRRKWQPTPEFLPGRSHVQRSLVGYGSRGLNHHHQWTLPSLTDLLLYSFQVATISLQTLLATAM